MKKASIFAVFTLLFAGGTFAQAKPAPAKTTSATKPNLTPDFAKAAFLYVEAVKNQSARRDDLLAEMKFATDDNASANKDFAASTFIENTFTLYMNTYIEGAQAGLPGMNEKIISCVVNVEQQLKSRTWVDAPKSCKP